MSELNEHGKALRQACADITGLLVLPEPGLITWCSLLVQAMERAEKALDAVHTNGPCEGKPGAALP